jgi:FkbM family methyltransferase
MINIYKVISSLIQAIRNKLIFALLLISFYQRITNRKQYIKLWLSASKGLILSLKLGVDIKITSRLDLFIIQEVFYEKIYNLNLKNPRNIIDIGGHIGLFSIEKALKYSSSVVWSYEPNKDTFEIFSENVAMNNIKNIKIFDIGVSSKAGKHLFYKDRNPSVSGFYKASSKHTKDIIGTISLEDVFRINKIKYCDLLKIDCEGAEFEILLNTPDHIFKKIGKLLVEYHDDFSRKYSHNDLEILLYY